MKRKQRVVRDGVLPPLGDIDRDVTGKVLTKMLRDYSGLSLAAPSNDGLIHMVATTKTKVIYGAGQTLQDALASVICESYLERP